MAVEAKYTVAIKDNVTAFIEKCVPILGNANVIALPMKGTRNEIKQMIKAFTFRRFPDVYAVFCVSIILWLVCLRCSMFAHFMG